MAARNGSVRGWQPPIRRMRRPGHGPRDLTRTMRSLAAAAAVSDLVPLSVCATALAGWGSFRDAPYRAHVIRGRRESVNPLPTDRN